MNYKKFKFTDNNFLIIKIANHFARTASGKSWKTRPYKTTAEIINAENYTNYITAVPFFNSFGDGAYCRAQRSYTEAGYLPTAVNTVSPGVEIKICTNFNFVSKSAMLDAGGHRERHIMNVAKEFIISADYPGCIEIKTDETGDCASGLYDWVNRNWRG